MRPTRSQGRFETETGKLPQRHCLRGSFLLDYARRGKGLVAGTRQRGRLGSSGLRGNIVGINRSSPASDALHPVAAEQTADVSLIGELVAIGERVQRLRVNGGVRELVEPSGDDTEGEHELRHILVAGKAQSGRTHVERVVLGSAQVVVCGCATGC